MKRVLVVVVVMVAMVGCLVPGNLHKSFFITFSLHFLPAACFVTDSTSQSCRPACPAGLDDVVSYFSVLKLPSWTIITPNLLAHRSRSPIGGWEFRQYHLPAG